MRINSNCFYITSTIFVLSIGLIFLLYFFLNRQINEAESKLFAQNQQIEIFYDKYSSLLFADTLSFVSGNKTVNSAFYIVSDNNDSICFLDYNKSQERKVLYFYYNELNCHICIDNELKIINEFKKYSNYKIVLLAKYKSMRDLFLFIRTNQLTNIEIYNISDNNLGLEVENYNTPFYFSVDENNFVRDLFIPEKLFPERSQVYLKTRHFN